MMKTALLLVPALAGAAPSPSLEGRQTQALCEQWGAWKGNDYFCYNNLWGSDQATSGSQCTYVDGASDAGIQWHTTWTWQGGQNNVKSYANCGREPPKGKLVSAVTSMKTAVTWAYAPSSVRANVAYDVFTAADPNHVTYNGDYEIMIWCGLSPFPFCCCCCCCCVSPMSPHWSSERRADTGLSLQARQIRWGRPHRVVDGQGRRCRPLLGPAHRQQRSDEGLQLRRGEPRHQLQCRRQALLQLPPEPPELPGQDAEPTW